MHKLLTSSHDFGLLLDVIWRLSPSELGNHEHVIITCLGRFSRKVKWVFHIYNNYDLLSVVDLGLGNFDWFLAKLCGLWGIKLDTDLKMLIQTTEIATFYSSMNFRQMNSSLSCQV